MLAVFDKKNNYLFTISQNTQFPHMDTYNSNNEVYLIMKSIINKSPHLCIYRTNLNKNAHKTNYRAFNLKNFEEFKVYFNQFEKVFNFTFDEKD